MSRNRWYKSRWCHIPATVCSMGGKEKRRWVPGVGVRDKEGCNRGGETDGLACKELIGGAKEKVGRRESRGLRL